MVRVRVMIWVSKVQGSGKGLRVMVTIRVMAM